MDDEFKLCWKNFQDNIASGFQNLYDRGDLVDVTLACDGKLLHAHKIVLAICSPYFQEIFITNPCKHPIIILKDVSFNIMLELLEFMYQGVVNVKHTELQAFMKIGQLLQIKGLATNTSSSAASTSSEKSSSHMNNADEGNLACGNDNNGNVGAGVASGDNKHLKAATDGGATGQAAAITGKVSNNNNNNNNNNSSSSNNNSAPSPPMVGDHVGRSQQHSPPPPPTTATSPTPSAMSYVANVLNQHSLKNTAESNVSPLLNLYQTTANSTGGASTGGLKRHLDAFSNDALSIYSRKQFRRSLPTAASEHNSGGDHTHDSADSNGAGGSGAAGSAAGAGAAAADQVNTDDFFLPTIPHISMVESRYDLNNLKREAEAHHGSSAAVAAAVSLRNTFGPAFNFEYNLYKNSAGGGGGGGGGCGSGSGAGTGLGVGVGSGTGTGTGAGSTISGQEYPNDLHMPNDYSKNFGNHMDIPQISPGEHWFQGKLEFMLSQRGKPLLVHDGHTFGIQYVRKDKKYWQCNLSRKFNCKARVTTTDTGEIIVTNNEHCHTEIRQHLRKDYQRNKVMMNALINLSTNRLAENLRRVTGNSTLGNLSNLQSMVSSHAHHADAHHMEQSILDLGKAAAAAAAVTAASVDSGMVSPHGNLACASLHDGDGDADADDDDDEEAPLDCGMRSASHVDGISKASTSTSSNGSAHGSSNPSDKWKGKLNNAPLDASQ